jgi:WhiB family redox-sensing transcriptional regulator
MTNWLRNAACRDEDPELFFPDSDVADVAVRICRTRCSVRLECLTRALDNGEQYGVWGGLTETQRRNVLRYRIPPAEAITLSPAPVARNTCTDTAANEVSR